MTPISTRCGNLNAFKPMPEKLNKSRDTSATPSLLRQGVQGQIAMAFARQETGAAINRVVPSTRQAGGY